MESAKVEVIVWRTWCESVKEAVNQTAVAQGWVIKLAGVPLALYIKEMPDLSPGDRVKITITKEPAVAEPR